MYISYATQQCLLEKQKQNESIRKIFFIKNFFIKNKNLLLEKQNESMKCITLFLFLSFLFEEIQVIYPRLLHYFAPLPKLFVVLYEYIH